MEPETLQEVHSEVRALGARIVVLTAELERYTRALHKKLNLSFDILTDLHLKTAEQFRWCSHFRITCASFTSRSAMLATLTPPGRVQMLLGFPLRLALETMNRRSNIYWALVVNPGVGAYLHG